MFFLFMFGPIVFLMFPYFFYFFGSVLEPQSQQQKNGIRKNLK